MESDLDYFLSTRFHQDFAVDHGDEWGVLDAFLTEEPDEASALPAEIGQLLASHPTEESLREYLAELGCEYRADPADGGYRGWLTEIARRVEAAKG